MIKGYGGYYIIQGSASAEAGDFMVNPLVQEGRDRDSAIVFIMKIMTPSNNC
jgi:hypothetical protein